MTTEGVDYAWGRPGAAALKAAGKTFAMRYLSHSTSGKNLTKSEATSLSSAGIDLGVVWETTSSRAKAGYAAGQQDAKDADAQAKACGMPNGKPIYFAVDFDASPGDKAAILNYFKGVASVIGKNRTGMYGGYYPIKWAFDAGDIAYGWQTYAWSGGKWDSRAQLRQYSNDHVIGGVGLDYDRSVKSDFGQWRVGGAPVPKPPTPHVTAPPFPGRTLTQPPAMSGTDVRTWQTQMAHRKWKIKVDGVYGPASEKVCREFQGEKHLAVDGKVGPVTWKASWEAPLS
jgi:peptidoglycan hydrolase-like protein with peptidoglycan-binding domain